MEILLIRHGDPDYANDCLTPTGIEEARRLAETLQEIHIDDIYVSPAGRAQETCSPTASLKGLEPVTLDWMRERGVARDGKCLWETPGDTFLATRPLPTQDDWFLAEGAMPEGREQFERVKTGFDELMAAHGYEREGHLYRSSAPNGKRIALFCHKGVILTLLSDLLHWAMPMIYVSLQIHPTGVTRLEMIENNGLAHLKALAINDLSHLGPTLQAPANGVLRKAGI